MSERDLFLAKAEFDQQKEYQKQVEAERQRIASEQAREQEQELRKHLEVQRSDMLNRIPAWQDEDVRETERREIITYAQKRIGFSEDEIANASDARAIELLYKRGVGTSFKTKPPPPRSAPESRRKWLRQADQKPSERLPIVLGKRPESALKAPARSMPLLTI